MIGPAAGDRPVLVVVGARPNFVKAAPVLAELSRRRLPHLLVHTGQHYDPALSDRIFADLALPAPDLHLGVGSGGHAAQTAAVLTAFEAVLAEHRPELVVVFGDVNSTVACTLAAAKAGVPVAHVEAGLRSGDWSMPEEVNRVVTDRLSHLLLAPSADAVANLRHEGARDDQVALVGNVMVDTLLAHLPSARGRQAPQRLGLDPGGYVLATLHRPSNVDDGRTLGPLLEALVAGAGDRPVVLPAHPRTRATLEVVAVPGSVLVIEPLGYLDFVDLQAEAQLVVTDSGGVQEETTVLGVPCLTVRTTTERPVTVTEGTNRLVGTDPIDLERATRHTLADPPPPRCPALWDGAAATRIVDVIEQGRWRTAPPPGPAPSVPLRPEAR